MPSIEEVLKKKKKKFVKKEHRAWNFTPDKKTTEQIQESEQVTLEKKEAEHTKPKTEEKEPAYKQKIFSTAQETKNQSNLTSDPNLFCSQAFKNTKTKPGLNQVETGSITGSDRVETKSKPSLNQVVTRSETSLKPGLKLDENKMFFFNENNINEIKLDISNLTGNQKQVFILFLHLCIKSNSDETGPIKTGVIGKILNIKYESIRTAIKALKLKKIVLKSFSKEGRGGFVNFKLAPEVKISALSQSNFSQSKLLADLKNINLETGFETGSNDIVVSSNINTTTTSYEEDNNNLDYSSLEEFGFSQSHLIQILNAYRKNPEIKLSTEIVQDSINALAYDLKHNDVAKTFKHSPIAVLVSMLKKGMPYSSRTPETYISPKEEAMISYLKQKKEKGERERKLESEIKKLAMEEWLSTLPEDDILEFCPDSDVAEGVPTKLRKSIRRKNGLELAKLYFDAEIWPKQKDIVKKGS